MDISDHINLSRVEVLEEDESTYTAMYDGEKYVISKGTESHFIAEACASPRAPPQQGMRLEQRMEVRIVPGITLGDIPEEFREIVIFHEIREMQYQGISEPHERAVNDEVLYTLKFFDDATRAAYFPWAEEHRKKHRKYTDEERKAFYELGMSGSDEEWKKQEEVAVIALQGNSELAWEAVKNWPLERLASHEDFVRMVFRDAEYAYGASEWFDLERLKVYADILVEFIEPSASYCCDVFSSWPDEVFDQYAHRFLNRIARDYERGDWTWEWNESRWDKYCLHLHGLRANLPGLSERLARSEPLDDEERAHYMQLLVEATIGAGPGDCFWAGKNWSDDMWEPHAEALSEVINRDEQLVKKANSWNCDRKEFIRSDN